MDVSDALIIDHDTLRAIGLRHLLRDNHSLTATIVSSAPAEPSAAEPALIFASERALVESPDYFLPRRQRLTVLAPASAGFNTLDMTADEETVTDRLDDIVTRLFKTRPAQHGRLSQREIEVLKLIARGMLNKEIPDRLDISLTTVLPPRKNITARLGIKSPSGLGLYALMHGYISLSDTTV